MAFGAIIAGALGGGAAQANEMATDSLKRSADLQSYKDRSAIEQAREESLSLFREKLNKQAKLDEVDTSTPGALGSRRLAVAETQARTSAGIQSEAQIKTHAAQKESDDKAFVKNWTDPTYAKAARTAAEANRVFSPAERASAALSNLALQREQAVVAAQTELQNARKTNSPDAIMAAEQKIRDLQSTGQESNKAADAYAQTTQRIMQLESKVQANQFASPEEKSQAQAELDKLRTVADQHLSRIPGMKEALAKADADKPRDMTLPGKGPGRYDPKAGTFTTRDGKVYKVQGGESGAAPTTPTAQSPQLPAALATPEADKRKAWDEEVSKKEAAAETERKAALRARFEKLPPGFFEGKSAAQIARAKNEFGEILTKDEMDRLQSIRSGSRLEGSIFKN